MSKHDHSAVLCKIPGVTFHRADPEHLNSARLNAAEWGLLQKLIADCWPWIGVRQVSFRLSSGKAYIPTFVTCDEGIAVAWEIGGGASTMLAVAETLPDDRRLMFITAQQVRGDWIEDDLTPRYVLADIPRDFLHLRATLGKWRGSEISNVQLRDYYRETCAHMAGKVTMLRAG